MRHAGSEYVIFSCVLAGLLVILAWTTKPAEQKAAILNDNQTDSETGQTGGMGPRSYVRSVSVSWYMPVAPQNQTRYSLVSETGMVDRYVSAHG